MKEPTLDNGLRYDTALSLLRLMIYRRRKVVICLEHVHACCTTAPSAVNATPMRTEDHALGALIMAHRRALP